MYATTDEIQGRFFAGTVIKILLAYVLQNYDLKLEPGAIRPVNSLDEVWFLPDQNATMLLRRRKLG
jgi:gliotoxin biosynthesis cytochrome P450 monooxygenase